MGTVPDKAISGPQGLALGELVEKVCCPHTESISYRVDVVDADVAFPALDTADVGAVEIGLVRQCLLTQAAFNSQFTEARTERDSSLLA